jgi:hypothetical protein
MRCKTPNVNISQRWEERTVSIDPPQNAHPRASAEARRHRDRERAPSTCHAENHMAHLEEPKHQNTQAHE